MSRLPIRLRVTVVFALAMALVLAGAGWFVYLHVADHLARALDQELRSRAQDVSALVEHGGSLEATGGTLIESGESFAQLLQFNGRVLDATPPIRDRLLTSAQLARARQEPVFTNRSSVPGLDEPARLLAVPLDREREIQVLVVGATRENRAETLRSLLTAFLIGGPLALLLASVGGYLLAGAALRPIEAMRRRAQEISTSSLDERLPVPRAGDEVARLGETLNVMLARLEAGLVRERRFAADASHELRTPLGLLKTELELALRRPRSPEELERSLRSAAEEADRLSRLAEDLLLLARLDEGRLPVRRSAVVPGELLDTVARRFAARAAETGRALEVAAPDDESFVGDRLRLEQALGNLVDNAFRYGAGTIRLEAERRDGYTDLRVSDEGPGFPPDFLPHAFERFTRADEARARGAAGLGLAIVDAIARAHGGTVHAANRDARGAVVELRLPAAVEVA